LRCSELHPQWQNTFYRLVEKKYLQSVDGFIFNSQTTKTAVNELIGQDKPSIVAHPPTDRFGAAISEEEIKARASDGTLRILFLGNVIRRKGLHVLLKALCLTEADVRLDIVGSETAEPAYAGKMREFTASNGLSTKVTFHSLLDRQPLVEKLKQAHILVVPSSYEGFGIVYLEGMGFGLPAIGTTAGAAGEIIEHGRTGFLIRPGDHGSLAVFIARLSKDRSLLVRLSLNARSRYNRQPAWSQTAGKIRAFLQSLVREK
jgi:glycosyltransferase involved in cell wall biosynthesis